MFNRSSKSFQFFQLPETSNGVHTMVEANSPPSLLPWTDYKGWKTWAASANMDKIFWQNRYHGPHNIILCTAPAIGYNSITDVDDTLFQQCRNTGNCSNKNSKKLSRTIIVATMHFYLLYNWIIFFICHARIKQSFFLAYSLAQPERKQQCHMNNFICVTHHMQPRSLFKLTWFLSVIICLFSILKECMCLHEQIPDTPQFWPKVTKF